MRSTLGPFAAFIALMVGTAACSDTEKLGSYPDGSSGGDTPGVVIPGPDARGPDAPIQGTDVLSPYCREIGLTCASGADCCSAVCDPTTLTCASAINACTATGGACTASTECCSLSCSGGRCSPQACVADGQACTTAASCCSGSCAGGLCQSLNPAATCRTAGNPCTANGECCSALCSGGVCELGSSFCIQNDDVCSSSDSCCSGDCVIKAGNTLGTCAEPPSGSSYCSGGVDGTVCSDCNNCCSRVCAPYGPTGVKVCQPASGCRVNGDLCRRDSDCCGAAGTGLPGDGNVTCQIEPGKALGICRNPLSCNPQGNVCHYKDYTCGSSSARNNCCAGTGNSGVCQLDFMGVPRCNGLGDTCIPTNGICASAQDCCNLAPCVPDGTGLLRCFGTPGGQDGGAPRIDGGLLPPVCVPVGGPCSVNADCCTGYTCIQPVGSTQGVCGIPQTPPRQIDAGVPDGPGPVCAEYGQLCASQADCCSEVPCTNGRCMYEYIIP